MQIGVQAHLNGIAWSSEFRTVVQRLVFIFFVFTWEAFQQDWVSKFKLLWLPWVMTSFVTRSRLKPDILFLVALAAPWPYLPLSLTATLKFRHKAWLLRLDTLQTFYQGSFALLQCFKPAVCLSFTLTTCPTTQARRALVALHKRLFYDWSLLILAYPYLFCSITTCAYPCSITTCLFHLF